MRILARTIAVVSLILLTTQTAEARYLMEMGRYNLRPYVGGAWHMGRTANESPIAGPGQVSNSGYVDDHNLYQYAMSNPINRTDPIGLWPCFCPWIPGSHTGWMRFDCSCRGRFGSIIPETGNAITSVRCGEWYKADGFTLHGNSYKVDGGTCVTVKCNPFPSEGAKTETCVTIIPRCLGMGSPYPFDWGDREGDEEHIHDPGLDELFTSK